VRWPDNIAADIGKFKNPLHLLNNPVPSAGSVEYPFEALSSNYTFQFDTASLESLNQG